MVHRRRFAVHNLFGADNLAAKGLSNTLMPQANAQNWQAAGKVRNRFY